MVMVLEPTTSWTPVSSRNNKTRAPAQVDLYFFKEASSTRSSQTVSHLNIIRTQSMLNYSERIRIVVFKMEGRAADWWLTF